VLDTENQIVYLNGHYSPLCDAKISVLDRGFLFGDGIYEVIPAYNGHLFHFDRHMARLEKNLAAIRLIAATNRNQLRDIIEKLLTGQDQESVYLQITRGVAKRDHGFPADTQATLFVMSSPVKPHPKHGISCITLNDDRWQHCDIKTIALLPNVLLRQLAHDQNTDEAILIRDGFVTEGAASNVFIVIDKQIVTAPQGPYVLPGVTRNLILELGKQANMDIQERMVVEQELIDASEIWISSSTKEIVPVTSLNQKPVSNGVPGAIWQQMNAIFQSHKQTLIR
jgi:D-alanine transaminase